MDDGQTLYLCDRKSSQEKLFIFYILYDNIEYKHIHKVISGRDGLIVCKVRESSDEEATSVDTVRCFPARFRWVDVTLNHKVHMNRVAGLLLSDDEVPGRVAGNKFQTGGEIKSFSPDIFLLNSTSPIFLVFSPPLLLRSDLLYEG